MNAWRSDKVWKMNNYFAIGLGLYTQWQFYFEQGVQFKGCNSSAPRIVGSAPPVSHHATKILLSLVAWIETLENQKFACTV